jgi:hypothetical protein
MSLTSEVPLFGAMRGGAVAIGYHLLYISLFLALGVGLWAARPWGYRVMFAGTVFYTLDKLLYLLDQHTLEADVFQRLHGYEVIFDVAGRESIFQMIMLLTVLSVFSWWAFLLYLYLHRAYFEAPSSQEDL